jgi:hypothetical protein
MTTGKSPSPTSLSKRKLESYKRAEVVAQALRKYIAAGNRVTQADIDHMADCLHDWMAVTGEIKYEDPVRRGRKNFRK